jgi:hypothetical protein
MRQGFFGVPPRHDGFSPDMQLNGNRTLGERFQFAHIGTQQ